MTRVRMALSIVLLALALACGDDATPVDAGDRGDGGPGLDAGGPTDAAAGDAGGDSEGGSTSDGGRPRRDAGPVPSVLADLELYRWTPISNNTLADVDPCPSRDCAWSAVEGQSAVLNDWTGGAFASGEGAFGGLVYFGGGHNGYYGNEVYFFDLETQLWERRNDPTDGETPGDRSTYGLDSSTGLWWDGRPLAIHTYDGVAYDPTTNRFLLLLPADAPAPPYVSGYFGAPYAHGFDFATNDWVAGEDACQKPGGFVASAYDPNRQLIWAWPQGGSTDALSSYDARSDTWTSYADDWVRGLDHVAAIDPTRDLFVLCEFRGSNAIYVKDLANPDAEAVEVTAAGATEIQTSQGLGFEWVESMGQFIAWHSGGPIYFLEPPAGDWRTEAWSWNRVATTGTPPKPDPTNNPYSKFQYAPNLGVALVATSRDGAVYAIRIVE